jgi:hypothetical protein
MVEERPECRGKSECSGVVDVDEMQRIQSSRAAANRCGWGDLSSAKIANLVVLAFSSS